MPTEQNSSGIRVKGSPNAAYKLSDANASYVGDTYLFPIIKDSNIARTPNVTDLVNEGGGKYKRSADADNQVDMTFMQSDLKTLSLPAELEGQYITFVKEISVTPIAGKIQYAVFPKAYVKGDLAIAAPSMEIPFTCYPEEVTVATGVNLAHFANSVFKTTLTGTVTLTAGTAHTIIEIAV